MSGYQGPDHEYIEWRDSQECTCGHRSISHGSHGPNGPVAVGGGPCGIDRDYRVSPEWVGDPCPCERFTELPEPVQSSRYAVAKNAVETGTAGTLEGSLLDTFTASALVAVYEAMSEKNRALFDTVPLPRLIDFVWKQVRG